MDKAYRDVQGAVGGTMECPSAPSQLSASIWNQSEMGELGSLYKGQQAPVEFGYLELLAQAPESTDKQTTASHAQRAEFSDVTNCGVSADYCAKVSSRLKQLPACVQTELEKHHVKVYVFKNIAAYDRKFGTHKSTMIVDGAALTNSAASLFDGHAKPPRIAVFEETPDGAKVNSYSRPSGLAIHEAGHAHSFFHGYLTVQDKNWQSKFSQDFNAMTEAQRREFMAECQKGRPLNHYFDGTSKEEFYAEAFAIVSGSCSDKYAEERFKKLFPRTLEYMKEQLK